MRDPLPKRTIASAWRLLGALGVSIVVGAGCSGCREPNGPCRVTSDCFASEVCVAEVCRSVCNADLDCTGRETCADGVCLPLGDAGVTDAAGDRTAADRGPVDRETLDGADREAARDGGTADRPVIDSWLDDRAGEDRPTPRDAAGDAAANDRSAGRDLARQDSTAVDTAQPDSWQPDQAVVDAAARDAGSLDAAAPDAGDCWYDPLFEQRWPLTVANPTTEMITDFPVLLRLDCALVDCGLFGNAGSQLRIVDQNCQLLPHEIEAWTGTGESLVWFRVPLLAAAGTRVYLYGKFGSGAEPAPLPASAVWSNGFQGVYHLSTDVADSSPLANDGTDSSTAQVSAAIGVGRQFDGSRAIELEDSQPLLRSVDGATVETWVNLTDASSTPGHNLLAIGIGSVSRTIYSRVQLGISGAWRATATVRRLDADPDQPQTVSPPLTRGTFHHVVVRARYGVPSLQAFVDGVQTADIPLTWLTAGLTADTDSRNAALGAQDDGNAAFMRGILDEVRVANVARSDAWIALDYLAQKAPGIVTVGTAEAGP